MPFFLCERQTPFRGWLLANVGTEVFLLSSVLIEWHQPLPRSESADIPIIPYTEHLRDYVAPSELRRYYYQKASVLPSSSSYVGHCCIISEWHLFRKEEILWYKFPFKIKIKTKPESWHKSKLSALQQSLFFIRRIIFGPETVGIFGNILRGRRATATSCQPTFSIRARHAASWQGGVRARRWSVAIPRETENRYGYILWNRLWLSS